MTTTAILVALAVMATVTYATRISGVWSINLVRPSARLTQALDAATGAVLLAIVAPAAADGDIASQIAIVTSVAVMVITRKPLLAVTVGVVVTALLRAV
jgi:uncharacterized membrane protein